MGVNWTTTVNDFDDKTLEDIPTDDQLEIIDAMKGKEQETGVPSRLAKATLFRRFMEILEDPNVALIQQTSTNNIHQPNKLVDNNMSDLMADAQKKRKEFCSQIHQYCVAKQAASNFQTKKTILFEAFKKEQLGTWVKKPMEQDEFALERSSEGDA